MLVLNGSCACAAVFPVRGSGPRIFDAEGGAAKYEQRAERSALPSWCQKRRGAGVVRRSPARRILAGSPWTNQMWRIKTASAFSCPTMGWNAQVTISVCCFTAWCARDRAIVGPQGRPDHQRHLRQPSKSLLEVSFNIAHLRHRPPGIRYSPAAAVRHNIHERLDDPTRGDDRPGAPYLPRITNDSPSTGVTFSMKGGQTPVPRYRSPSSTSQTMCHRRQDGFRQEHAVECLILGLYSPGRGPVPWTGRQHQEVDARLFGRGMASCSRRTCWFNCRAAKKHPTPSSSGKERLRPTK